MDEIKILNSEEATKIRASIIPLKKLVKHLRDKKALEYYETFVMDAILEFLDLLSDIVTFYEQLS